ncbi:P2X purinoceptor 6-like [Oppia nitens]|uniref:P2X purinoceptor 6-like n=1 Tax=Oppia nitens TaxID=1686743 RepID=UPI0023D9E4FE|nr:P2X purinoceptor 6-like [Oppia nitens]
MISHLLVILGFNWFIDLYRITFDPKRPICQLIEDKGQGVSDNQLLVTRGQRLANCGEHPELHGSLCDTDADCEQRAMTPNGRQTSRCVRSDIPIHFDNNDTWSWVNTCEIYGYCPVDSHYPPLKGFRALLSDTQYSTLWIENSVYFPDTGQVVSNQFNRPHNHSDRLLCHYNRYNNPFCPIFLLKDLIENADNNNESYKILTGGDGSSGGGNVGDGVSTGGGSSGGGNVIWKMENLC